MCVLQPVIELDQEVDRVRRFDLLDDFLFELNPVMVNWATCRGSRPPAEGGGARADELAKNLPGFNKWAPASR